MQHESGRARVVARRLLAVLTALAAVACAAVSVRLDLTAPPVPEFGSAVGGALPGLALALPGALLLWRMRVHPIAVVLAVFGVLWGLDGVSVGVLNTAMLTGEDSPLISAAFWYYVRFGAVLLLPIQLVLLLFPDGRLAQGIWRPVSLVSLALTAIMPVTFLFAPSSALADQDRARESLLERFDTPPPSLPVPDEVWALLLTWAFPASIVAAALALAVTVSRRRGASPERIAQLRWLIWAGLVFVVLTSLARVLPGVVADFLFMLTVGFVSAAIVIAITRHGLYSIDRLLSWTVLYAVLIGSIVLIDLGVYLLLGSMFGDRVTTLIALCVAAALYLPLRDRLHRLISRWVNGARVDPYEVMSRLAGRLESAGAPQAQLDELADAVAQAFASSAVRVELDRADGSALVSTVGAASEADSALPLELPLQYQGAEIGRIRMRPGRRAAISERDRRLLGDIVRLAAAALQGAELSRELQLIRESLVEAREDERAHLRRELHDGLGPLLGAIRLRLEAARNLAERDPARSLLALDAALEESREVVDEIRRLAHDLRPPAIDDLGLARAIDQLCARLGAGSLDIRVESDDLPPLGAAVEVAAYRIVSEAITNVVRHARAKSAVVRLRALSSSLIVEVEDDGIGIRPDRTAGVGLASLRERAGELGGATTFGSADPGTVVRAVLPRRTEDSRVGA